VTNLRGKRIVITRPRDKADAFAAALDELGAHPIFFPTIQISPVQDTLILDRALRRLTCYDWIVLTSISAVQVVWDRLEVLDIERLPETLRLAAVGPKTAEALKERGARVDFIPQEFTGEAILPGLGDLRGRWVLLPVADIAHRSLPDGILAAGGAPHVVIAYHTRPAQADPTGLQELREGVDVVAFTSGSTAQNFFSLVREAGFDPFDLPGDPLIACIGPKTARAAKEVGFDVDIVAEAYTVEGLIEAIQEGLAK
jgi:uroporphyrinogen III methyltransferase/synthase